MSENSENSPSVQSLKDDVEKAQTVDTDEKIEKPVPVSFVVQFAPDDPENPKVSNSLHWQQTATRSFFP